MRTIELKPIRETTADYDRIEARIKKAFRDIIYLPLLKSLGLAKNTIKNADEYLVDALKKGKITYSKGAFRGKFSATISKELKALGAVWDKKTASWKIARSKLPYDLRSEINLSESYFREQLEKIDKRLAQILPTHLSEKIKLADLFDSSLWKVEKEFQKSVANITVTPQLTELQRAEIAKQWQNNMDLWINNFTEEHIIELRQTVQQSVFAGNRWESLVDGIQKSYGVTARKAKFLARQETHLLMGEFQKTRFLAAGIPEYKWVCVHMPHDTSPDVHIPGNVRYYHGKLGDRSKAGELFRWDDPPIDGEKPQTRNNPGMNYNCRCYAIPVVRFA